MSPQSTQEYLRVVRCRYRNTSSKREKSSILDAVYQNLGYHRKHAIRVLRSFRYYTKPKPQKKGKKPLYDKPDIVTPLKRI